MTATWPSSASTPACRTRTFRSSRRCIMRASTTTPRSTCILSMAKNLMTATSKRCWGPWTGILVPGGFGQRAFEGKICAVRYARTHDVPFWASAWACRRRVRVARDVAGMPGATSAEFDENAEFPVIDLMPEQEDVEDKGGTMRLGAYPCKGRSRVHGLQGLRRGAHLRAPSPSL